MQKKSLLRIDKDDNVLVALDDLRPQSLSVEGQLLSIKEKVPSKHKVTSVALKKGDKVIMYGVPVGQVTEDLPEGSLLTTDRLVHYSKAASLQYREQLSFRAPDVSIWESRQFMGYHRSDGRVGTANYWLFVPLVFCENRNLKVLEDTLTTALGYQKPNPYLDFTHTILGKVGKQTAKAPQVFENIDGLRFLYHSGGCGGTREDSEALLRLLAGYVHHPNVAGATVLSLGCQNAQVEWFKKIQSQLYPKSQKPIIYLEQQAEKSERRLLEKAIAKTLEQLQRANEAQRKPADLNKLIIGMECGGSDGFSGISANPAVGLTADILNTIGGSTMLAEFPELNGVEQDLVNRCTTEKIASKFLQLQKAYHQRAKAVGSGFEANPSPGNIKDGLITDAMKSAGAAKKGGRGPIVDVLDYTEPLQRSGLNLVCTPGNDVESTTAMVGSGANMVLFTTGLGTPTGNPIAPVIKISSNTKLYEEMNDIIDLNAGAIIKGEKTVGQVAHEIMEELIAVASGKATKAMLLEQNDFIPWKRGVSL